MGQLILSLKLMVLNLALHFYPFICLDGQKSMSLRSLEITKIVIKKFSNFDSVSKVILVMDRRTLILPPTMKDKNSSKMWI